MADNKKNYNNNRNPLNQQNDLFKALTRLFSGPIVNYRSQTGTKIRRQHLDKFSSRFRTASGQQFKKSQYSPLDNLALNAMQNQRRVERYIDFDQMEYMPEIASALDIYADEMTTYSDLRPMLNIKCSNEEIKAVLSNLHKGVECGIQPFWLGTNNVQVWRLFLVSGYGRQIWSTVRLFLYQSPKLKDLKVKTPLTLITSNTNGTLLV